ncbi:hypothetical protein GCM10028805_34400 [Spirosoma harenae]
MATFNTIWRALFLLCFILPQASELEAQCKQSYSWTTWREFLGNQAKGTITVGQKTVNVTMSANYAFSSTNTIYNFSAFSKFSGFSAVPNSTVPQTEWLDSNGGITTMCFSEPVTNPVLLISSLGQVDKIVGKNVSVTLSFSQPYNVVYDGGGMDFIDSYSLSGVEGYTIILFPGTFTCLTINSKTPEYYTNITWGLQDPSYPVIIADSLAECGSVTLTVSGGDSYKWSGGENPNSSKNRIKISGPYSVTATDRNGCTAIAVKNITEIPEQPSIKSDEKLCLNSASISLEPGATGKGLVYQWEPTGDIAPIIEVQQSGVYKVKVTNQFNCSVERTIVVTGPCSSTVFAPDVFTPNDDQLNDTFKLIVTEGIQIKLLIYNRWGEVIYSEENANPQWDGKYKDEKCLNGIYPYKLTYTSLVNKETLEHQGVIMLLR